ncbi:MAG: histidine phosphatase family protein [Pseudomonadota bacterium]
MKTLALVRHAKSSWDHPGLADFERPLNKRGRRDAPRMGSRLAEHYIRPDLIVSSPAVRALTTAEVIASHIGYQPSEIINDRRVYHASSSELLAVIREFDARHQTVMLVGHNPGLTDLVEQLAYAGITNIPTCGIVMLGFSANHWPEATAENCELQTYDYPKK